MAKGKWRVTSNSICGKMMYSVYQLRNTDLIDHSGNREHYGNYMENKEEAQALADELNGNEGGGSDGNW